MWEVINIDTGRHYQWHRLHRFIFLFAAVSTSKSIGVKMDLMPLVGVLRVLVVCLLCL